MELTWPCAGQGKMSTWVEGEEEEEEEEEVGVDVCSGFIFLLSRAYACVVAVRCSNSCAASEGTRVLGKLVVLEWKVWMGPNNY